MAQKKHIYIIICYIYLVWVYIIPSSAGGATAVPLHISKLEFWNSLDARV